jgi:putative FmdB family regulatory protein
MPIYEYRCGKCGKLASFLVRNVATHHAPACPKCGHPKMVKALSRFIAARKGKTSAAAAEVAAAPAGAADMGAPPGGAEEGPMPDMSAFDGIDENDPRSMGRALRQMAGQSGENLDPEMEEVVRRLEGGEDPESIDDKMGDVMGGGPGGASDDTLYEG